MKLLGIIRVKKKLYKQGSNNVFLIRKGMKDMFWLREKSDFCKVEGLIVSEC